MRRLGVASFALSSALAVAAPSVPHFVDETDAAGIQSRFDGEWEYMVGGGVAAFDCDGSGLPSLFMAGRADPTQFFPDPGAGGGGLELGAQGDRPGPPNTHEGY